MLPAMTEFAIIDSGVIVAFRDLDDVPSLEGKPYRVILPVETTNPAFNSATQVRTGPVITIEATRVTRVWTVTNKTAQQLTDEANASRDAAVAQLDQLEDMLRAVLLVLKDEFNRHSDYAAAVKAQTALATSLANLQTRLAAISVVPTRTTAELRTAVRNKLGQTNGP
jgi:hypothetical protein